MAFNVNSFRSQLAYDGARPNLFEVELTFPFFAAGDTSLARFMCKSAALPGSTIGVVEVPYFGRQIKVAGNRTFAEWTVTVINDENFKIRNTMEAWHRGINSQEPNLRIANANTTYDYGVNASVVQYGKDGVALKTYTFIGMFPSDISQIDLDWGSNDTIEEFSVTFAYQYWESTT